MIEIMIYLAVLCLLGLTTPVLYLLGIKWLLKELDKPWGIISQTADKYLNIKQEETRKKPDKSSDARPPTDEEIASYIKRNGGFRF